MVKPHFRRTEDKSLARQFAGIHDAAAARAWLATIAPDDLVQKLPRVAELIGEVIEGPLPFERKYEIIDRIRPLIYTALRDGIDNVDIRGVPISFGEGEQIWVLIDTAESLRDAYELMVARLEEKRAPSAPGAQREGAEAPTKIMALQRAIDVNGHCLCLYERMRVAIPERLWDHHCRLGQLARELGSQNEVITDPYGVSVCENARAAFNLPLLVALADPATLSQDEFQSAYLCAVRWAGKVGYRIESADEGGELPPRPTANPGPVFPLAGGLHQVRLDTQKVQESLERRLVGLSEGKSPRSLGLSDGMSAGGARTFFQALVRRWGAIMPESIDFPEHTWRPSTSEFALAVITAATGEAPRHAPAPAAGAPTYDYLRMRDDRLTQSQGEIERARIARLLEDAETWTMVGETPDSILSVRRHIKPRLVLGQLIGIKLGGKAGPTPFLLGVVQGLQQGVHEDGEGVARPASTHLVRVRLIPGLPQSIRVGVDNIDLDPSYLLVPHSTPHDEHSIWEHARAAPAAYSLVLPPSSFRPGRTVRAVAGGVAAPLQLESLIHRGLDFDHVRFKLV